MSFARWLPLLLLFTLPAVAQERLDRFGDPLPKGAAFRIGTLRFKHPGDVEALAFSHDGKWIATGADRAVRIWQVSTGRLVRVLPQEAVTRRLRFSPRGALITVDHDGTLRVWGPQFDKPQRMFELNDSDDLLISRDGRIVVDEEGVREIGCGKRLYELELTRWAVALDPTGQRIAVGLEKKIELRRLSDGKFLRALPRKQEVDTMAFSADGAQLFTVADDGRIDAWQVDSGKRLMTIPGKAQPMSIRVSPVGDWLAIAGYDQKIRLWNIREGRLIRTLQGNPVDIKAIAFSPDGRLLAAGGDDHILRIWNLASGRLVNPIEAHPLGVRAVALADDGRVATGGLGGQIHLWKDGRRIRTLASQPESVEQLAFSPDGKQLAWSGTSRKVRLLDSSSGALIRELLVRPEARAPHELQFTADGRGLLAAVYRGLDWFDLDSGLLIRAVHSEYGRPQVLLRTDGSLQVAGTTLNIGIWTRRPGLRRIEYSWTMESELAQTRGGRHVAVSTLYKEVHLLDCRSGRLLHALPDARKLASSADGRLLATADREGLIRLYDTARYTELLRLRCESGDFGKLVFSRNGRRLALITGRLTLVVWDLPAFSFETPPRARPSPVLRRLGRSHLLHLGEIGRVVFSADGRVLATQAGGSLRLFDVRSSRLLLRLDIGYRGRFVFSPDGQHIAVATDDRLLRIWQIDTGKLRAICEGESGRIRVVAYSPDGQIVASAGDDGSVRLWDANSGKPLATLAGHSAAVESLAFSPDGKTLASAGMDRRIRLWQKGQQTEVIACGARTSRLGFSPDGQKLAGITDGKFWGRDVRTGKGLPGLAALGDVESFAFSSGGDLLALACQTKLQLRRVRDGQLIREVSATDDGRLSSVRRDAGGRLLGTLHKALKEPGPISVWDLGSGKRLGGSGGPSTGHALSPDGKLLALGTSDAQIRIVELATGKPLERFLGGTPIHALAFSPDGKTLACGRGRRIELIDAVSGKLQRALVGHAAEVVMTAFGRGGLLVSRARDAHRILAWQTGASPAADPTVERLIGALGSSRFKLRSSARQKLESLGFLAYPHLLRHRGTADLEASSRIRKLLLRLRVTSHQGDVRSLALSPDGRGLASSCTRCGITLKDGRGVRRFPVGPLDIGSMGFSPDGKLLAAGAGSDGLLLVDTVSGKLQRKLDGARGLWAHRVAFSPDGRLLAVSHGLGLRLLRLSSGKMVCDLGGYLMKFAFSPDSKLIAAVCDDSSLRIWRSDTGELLTLYRAHTREISAVAFSPDGKQLATASLDGSIVFWRVPR